MIVLTNEAARRGPSPYDSIRWRPARRILPAADQGRFLTLATAPIINNFNGEKRPGAVPLETIAHRTATKVKPPSLVVRVLGRRSGCLWCGWTRRLFRHKRLSAVMSQRAQPLLGFSKLERPAKAGELTQHSCFFFIVRERGTDENHVVPSDHDHVRLRRRCDVQSFQAPTLVL